VAENQNQNITLSVPKQLLKRVKRVAADRDTSVSALMTEALDRLADDAKADALKRAGLP
jgi:post-segregation antitoxin (ccd killing protein)